MTAYLLPIQEDTTYNDVLEGGIVDDEFFEGVFDELTPDPLSPNYFRARIQINVEETMFSMPPTTLSKDCLNILTEWFSMFAVRFERMKIESILYRTNKIVVKLRLRDPTPFGDMKKTVENIAESLVSSVLHNHKIEIMLTRVFSVKIIQYDHLKL